MFDATRRSFIETVAAMSTGIPGQIADVSSEPTARCLASRNRLEPVMNTDDLMPFTIEEDRFAEFLFNSGEPTWFTGFDSTESRCLFSVPEQTSPPIDIITFHVTGSDDQMEQLQTYLTEAYEDVETDNAQMHQRRYIEGEMTVQRYDFLDAVEAQSAAICATSGAIGLVDTLALPRLGELPKKICNHLVDTRHI